MIAMYGSVALPTTHVCPLVAVTATSKQTRPGAIEVSASCALVATIGESIHAQNLLTCLLRPGFHANQQQHLALAHVYCEGKSSSNLRVTIRLPRVESGNAGQSTGRQTACGLPIRQRARMTAAPKEPGTADLLGLSDDENDPHAANRLPRAYPEPSSQRKKTRSGADGQPDLTEEDIDR